MDKIILDIEPYSFTLSAVIIGILLTNELSLEEMSSFGNWLQLTGLVVQTYASQVATINSNNTSDIDVVKESIEKLKKEIETIKKSHH